MQMIVTAESGTTVKMRSKPSQSGVVVENILIGTVVEAGESQDGIWTPITAPDGRKGYMMSKYLAPASESAEGNHPGDDIAVYARTLTDNELETLRESISMIESKVAVMKAILWG